MIFYDLAYFTSDFVYINVKGRFERDYMSIAELSEQKSANVIGNSAHNEENDDDHNEIEATGKNEASRRSSVYL